MRKEWIAILVIFACLMTSCGTSHTMPTVSPDSVLTIQNDELTLPTNVPGESTIPDPTGLQKAEEPELPVFTDEEHLRKVIMAYYESRAAYLSSDGQSLMTVAVDDMIQDEALHLQVLRDKGITFLNSEIAIYEVYNESTHAFVYVTETITYQMEGQTLTEEVPHYLYVSAGQDGIVCSDGYQESCSGFTSCAYVESEE